MEMKHAELTMDLTNGTRREIENPLGTTFDLAQIRVSTYPDELESSCFFHAWGEEQESAFGERLGFWLISTHKLLVFEIAKGGRRHLPSYFRTLDDGADIDEVLFFPLPPELHNMNNVLVKVELIYMG
jgi:hypothetical protein